MIDPVQKLHKLIGSKLHPSKGTYVPVVMSANSRALSCYAPPTPNSPIDFLNCGRVMQPSSLKRSKRVLILVISMEGKRYIQG